METTEENLLKKLKYCQFRLKTIKIKKNLSITTMIEKEKKKK